MGKLAVGRVRAREAVLAHADRQHEVGIERREVLAVQRMVGLHRAVELVAVGDPRADAVGERVQPLRGAALPDAVAHVQQRSLRRGERPHHRLDLGVARVTGAQFRQRPLDDGGLDRLHADGVLIDRQVHRSDGRRHGGQHRAVHRVRQTGRVDNGPARLYVRRREVGGAKAVVDMMAPAALVDRAAGIGRVGQGHHRQLGVPHVQHLPQRLAKAGVQVREHHRRPRPHLGVTASHRRNHALVQPEDTVDAGAAVQRVEERRFMRARVVEYVAHAEGGELFHHHLRRRPRERPGGACRGHTSHTPCCITLAPHGKPWRSRRPRCPRRVAGR